jgi:2-polyprenyl-3-methyl-5-hydroxy-6-metoxy-1,4-benzoquinol methylase
MKKYLVRFLLPMPYRVKKFVVDTWAKFTESGKATSGGGIVVVSSWGELIELGEFYNLHHANKYWWAGQQIEPPKKIFDVGCGSGYGSSYLSSLGNTVFAYDPDEKAIAWARKHFESTSLKFSQTKVFYEYKYDVITCFEVIEHVRHPETPESFLFSLSQILEKNGLLLISTANASKQSVRHWLILNRLATRNPTHVKEFTPEEFRQLLEKYFTHVQLYGHCVKGVYGFKNWKKQRSRITKLTDFEMRPDDFINCETIVAVCRK